MFLLPQTAVLICSGNTKVGGGLLLELVHGLTGLGDVDAVVALLHDLASPFSMFWGLAGNSLTRFSGDMQKTRKSRQKRK